MTIVHTGTDPVACEVEPAHLTSPGARCAAEPTSAALALPVEPQHHAHPETHIS